MASWEDITSPKAIIGRRQIHSEQGGATVFCVVLADGFILDCGCDCHSERRAALLARMVNRCGPEQFDFDHRALSDAAEGGQ